MSKQQLLVEADSRERSGTASVRRMRHEGLVPGVVYGAEEDNANIKMDHNKILHNLQNEAFHSSILELKIDGKSEKVILRDYEVHPASDVKIMHIDFQRVSRKEKLSMSVPLVILGEEECDGINLEGGIAFHIMNDIDIVCLPADLPEHIEIDVSKMQLGETITLADLTFPDGVESQILVSGGEDTQAVFQIAAPKAEVIEEVEVVEDGEAAEGEAEGGEPEAKEGDE